MGATAVVEPASSPSERPLSRLERRKARTRAAILEAASFLFDLHGYDDTSIQQVAARADTGVGTLYGYFRSKEELLKEVLSERTSHAVAGYLASIPAGATMVDRVVSACGIFSGFIQANRSILLATFQASTRRGFEMEDAPAEWLFVALRQMIAAGIHAGEMREVPIDATARAILGIHLMGVLGIGIFKDRANDPELVTDLQTIARLLLQK